VLVRMAIRHSIIDGYVYSDLASTKDVIKEAYSRLEDKIVD